MDRYQQPQHPSDDYNDAHEERLLGIPSRAPLPYPDSVPAAPYHAPSPYPAPQMQSLKPSEDIRVADKFEPTRQSKTTRLRSKKLSKKWQKRLYWIVPLGILVIILVVVFEVYKDDFEKWVQPLATWLTDRDDWSWIIPVSILFILSFPPLFGHELVQIIVGLSYPIGVAIGIAIAGAILGEAACFLVFKYKFTWWVDKKIASSVKWAAVTRVSQQAGFRGVLIIRYSVVPPHLANPLFSCTGMTFWLYMVTVILSLPKTIVFVVLGSPTAKGSTGAKWAKVVAIAVVVIITLFASLWIRKKMTAATEEIERERGIVHSDEEQDEELGMLGPSQTATHSILPEDTSYHGAGSTRQYGYPESGTPSRQQSWEPVR